MAANEIGPISVKCGNEYISHRPGNCDFFASQLLGSTITQPCFNPNDNNLIVFVEYGSLIKYNVKSFQKTLLLRDVGLILYPDGSRSGWIVFSTGSNLWRIDENGENLLQLTNAPMAIWPKCDPTGNKLVYPREMNYTVWDVTMNPELRKDYKMMVLDIEGSPIDSSCRLIGDDQCYPWSYCDWSPGGSRFAAEEYGLAIYSDNGEKESHPYRASSDAQKNTDPFICDMEWHPNNGNIYFQDDVGIRYVNVSDKKVRKLKISCPDATYKDLSLEMVNI